MNGEGVTGGELVREEVSLRREMQRRPEHSFHFSIASLLFSSHRDWACCLLLTVSQPSPDHLSPPSLFARARRKKREEPVRKARCRRDLRCREERIPDETGNKILSFLLTFVRAPLVARAREREGRRY